MLLKDFHFDLPSHLIARYPQAKRSDSRLLCINGDNGTQTHRQFNDLIEFIEEGDLLIFNDTKVIPARLIGRKNSGGRVELLVERVLDKHRVLAQVRASKPLKIGSTLFFDASISFKVMNRQDQFYELKYIESCQTILEAIEMIGQIPLPPYLHRLPDKNDIERYQTVYAKYKGSVAAPTAGFHFDKELLVKLAEKKIEIGYLTLHIGAGTFSPLRVENIKEHKMHSEYFKIDEDLCLKIKNAKAHHKRVISVGTTSLRALETASQSGETQPYQGETSIFIYPGYDFRCVDALITNFHLPCSTLLMLVCAFGGYDSVMQAYQQAVKQAYRFYSYGDAMWLERKNN